MKKAAYISAVLTAVFCTAALCSCGTAQQVTEDSVIEETVPSAAGTTDTETTETEPQTETVTEAVSGTAAETAEPADDAAEAPIAAPVPATLPPAPAPPQPEKIAQDDVQGYAAVLDELLKAYGEPEVRDDEYGWGLKWLSGLYVNLFDMDCDGIEEMYAGYTSGSYGTGRFWIYTLSDGKPVEIYSDEIVSRHDARVKDIIHNTATGEYYFWIDTYEYNMVGKEQPDGTIPGAEIVYRKKGNKLERAEEFSNRKTNPDAADEINSWMTGQIIVYADSGAVVPIETDLTEYGAKEYKLYGFREWGDGSNLGTAQAAIRRILG